MQVLRLKGTIKAANEAEERITLQQELIDRALCLIGADPVLEDRRRRLEQSLGRKRYLHTLGTVLQAEALCVRYGVPELKEKALRAALLHDCAKQMPEAKLRLLSGEEKGCAFPVLHAFAGAVVALTEYGEKDEDVLRAIRRHCTGEKGMTVLDKIIYLADLTEPGRAFEGVDRYRSLLGSEPDTLLCTHLRENAAMLRREGHGLHPATQRALQDLTTKQTDRR